MRDNPMASRLARLSDQWASFCENEAARILCWQLTAAELSAFDAFLELESDDRTAEHDTLFVLLDTAFDRADDYGRCMSHTLASGVDQGQTELQALSLPTGWNAPLPNKQETDPAYWVRVCESFLRFFEVRTDLGLVLRPKSVVDATKFADWLNQLARLAPKQLRVIVLDEMEAPVLAPLLAANAPRVVCQRADLDIPGALIELSTAAGNLDTPGGKFRDLFVRMGAALQSGELTRATEYADAALAVAKEHALVHLAVPVNIALGSNLLASKRTAEGLARYLEAQSLAKTGSEQPDEALANLCKKLELQARMAHAAALAGLARYPEAAKLFEEIAGIAAVAGDRTAAVDTRRLASFCYEQAGDKASAWKAAQLALEQAKELSAPDREQANFGALAQALQRMAAGQPTQVARPVLAQVAQLSRKDPEPSNVAPAARDNV